MFKSLFGYVFLRVFSLEIHIFIDLLNTCHICFRVVSEFDFFSTTDVFCSPVEISKIYWAAYFTCNCVESCLPAPYWFSCSFWCKGKVYHFLFLHLFDDTEYDIASSLSVDWDTADLAKYPSERSPEKFAFNHTVDVSSN